MVGRENCLVHHNEAEITLVSYKLKFGEKAPVLMEKWDRSVLDINTMLSLRWEWNAKVCHSAIRFLSMWKGEVPSIKKPQKFPALNEVLGEHDVTQSDLMDIGETCFLSVYSENICQLHRYNIHRKKPPTLNSLPPPPLRISTWISIIVALVSKCGRLSLRKCHKSKAAQEIAKFGWQIAEGSQVMKFTS